MPQYYGHFSDKLQPGSQLRPVFQSFNLYARRPVCTPPPRLTLHALNALDRALTIKNGVGQRFSRYDALAAVRSFS
jgi:hypothetical protein